MAAQQSLFWDGRRESLEAQAFDPLLNPLEHGLATPDQVLDVIRMDPEYVRCMKLAFGVARAAIDTHHIAKSLAAFQRRLVSTPTPFDRYLANDAAAMPEAAVRGWRLFGDRAQCIRCHGTEGSRPLFTDHRFHSLAVGLGRIERDLPALTRRISALRDEGRSSDREILTDPAIAELGRFAVTGDLADLGRFKTPGLRNVALTAPYMHDGSVATLHQAIELEVYYRSNDLGRPLILTPAEIDDLVAFLNALTSNPLPTYAIDRPHAGSGTATATARRGLATQRSASASAQKFSCAKSAR